MYHLKKSSVFSQICHTLLIGREAQNVANVVESVAEIVG